MCDKKVIPDDMISDVQLTFFLFVLTCLELYMSFRICMPFQKRRFVILYEDISMGMYLFFKNVSCLNKFLVFLLNSLLYIKCFIMPWKLTTQNFLLVYHLFADIWILIWTRHCSSSVLEGKLQLH